MMSARSTTTLPMKSRPVRQGVSPVASDGHRQAAVPIIDTGVTELVHIGQAVMAFGGGVEARRERSIVNPYQARVEPPWATTNTNLPGR